METAKTSIWRSKQQAATRMEYKKRLRQNLPLLAMFIPVIIYFIVFKYSPMFGQIIAFKKYTFAQGIIGSPWVGWDNFEFIFSNPNAVNIIRNTFMLSVLSVFIGFPFPIILAIMLTEVRKTWFKKSVQTLVFLPHFLSWVIVGGMIALIFSQTTGVVNTVVDYLFGFKYAFLMKPGSWITIFVGSGIWKGAGWSAIIYLAALTNIDQSLYEAADIDGAGKWRKIWSVSIPGILPMIILMFILAMGNIMEVGFDQVYVLQNAAVLDVSEVISTYIYTYGLQNGLFSITAAMGLFDSLIGFILILTVNQIARKFDRGLW